MPKRGPPTQLLADFGNAFGDHFRAKRLSLSGAGASERSASFDQVDARLLTARISGLDLTPSGDLGQPRKESITRAVKSRPQPFCLYFRAYKKGGYSGDDDIYYAAYLRESERTGSQLVQIICKKLSVDYGLVKEILVAGLDSDDSAMPLSDTWVGGLKAKQTLEIECTPYGGETSDAQSLQMKIRL